MNELPNQEMFKSKLEVATSMLDKALDECCARQREEDLKKIQEQN